MNRAIQTAIAGRGVDSVAERVKGARGVEAHLEEHAGRRPESEGG
jgi:hypothetical protein